MLSLKGVPLDLIIRIGYHLEYFEDWLSFICMSRQISNAIRTRHISQLRPGRNDIYHSDDGLKWRFTRTQGSVIQSKTHSLKQYLRFSARDCTILDDKLNVVPYFYLRLRREKDIDDLHEQLCKYTHDICEPDPDKLVNQYFPYGTICISSWRKISLEKELVFIEDKNIIEIICHRSPDYRDDYFSSDYDIIANDISMYIGGEDIFNEIFEELEKILDHLNEE